MKEKLPVSIFGSGIIAFLITALLLQIGDDKLPLIDRSHPRSVHLAKSAWNLTPCGDMFEGCVMNWQHSPRLKLTLEKEPDMPKENCLRVDNPAGGQGVLEIKTLNLTKRIGIFYRLKRRGDIKAEFDLKSGGQRIPLPEPSWANVFPSGWFVTSGSVQCPFEPKPGELAISVKGMGTVWLEDVTLTGWPK